MAKKKKKKDTQLSAKVDEDVAKMKKQVNEIIDLDMVENLLGNNQLTFEYNSVHYRVNRPSFKQKQLANEKRIQKYTELIQKDDYLMEKDLRKIYKKRGMDIEELEKQFDLMEKNKEKYMYQLGDMIKQKKPENELKVIRDEIQKIWDEQQKKTMEKAVLLEASIENQTLTYIYSYLTFLITEKKEGEKWVPAWNSYDAFMNSPEKIVNMAVFHASLVSKNELPEV